ncbi:MAG TPA: YceI family protein [Thermoanaerobaculia bacterium]|jgi:polyisoprenoid-binding protein YceI|nr:YceI family protein [Thermoanaerobaculia bacterium]
MPKPRLPIRLLTVLLVLVPSVLGAASVRFTLEPSRSHLYVVTHRAGALGFLGHEHAILATEWSADLCFDPAAPASPPVRAEITVPTKALRIDTDEGRRLAGLGKGPGPEDVKTLQVKVLAPQNLAAESHSSIRLKATSVTGTGGKVEVQGSFTLRGVTDTARFPVTIEQQKGGSVRLSGQFRLKQSTFGIKPESVAGVVNVADTVDVHFDIVAKPTGEGCP